MSPIFVLSASFRRLVPKLTAAAVVLALLTGGLEVHSHTAGGAGRVADLGRWVAFDPAAAHPDQSRHCEEGSEEERPLRTACLYGLALRGLRLPIAATVRIDRPPSPV